MGLLSLATGLFKPRTAIVLLLAIGGWVAYVWLRPVPEDTLDQARREVAIEACWRVVERLPDLPDDAVLAVTPLAGDTDGHVTERLRTCLAQSGRVALPEEGLLERIKRELGFTESAPPDRDAAIELARRADASHALTGRVADFGVIREDARIDLRLHIIPVDGGQAMSLAVALPDPAESARWSAGIWRVVGWIAVALALPLVCWPIVRRVLELESNPATLALLVGLSALVAAGAMWLWDTGSDWVGALAVPAAFLASVVYNYFIFGRVEASRH